MAYYDALIAQWGQLVGTTSEKLAAINAMTVAGPRQDVPVGSVEAAMSLQGILTQLEDWLATAPATGVARTAAKELLRTIASPHVPTFAMSDPTVFATIDGMLMSLTQDPPAILSAQQVAAVLSLANTTIPWWRAAGYSSPISESDLEMAGGLT